MTGMPVVKRISALFLALLLPLSVSAENTVEVLPTSAPMPAPVINKNDYAFEDLEPFYEQYSQDTPYMKPALTETEEQRLSEALRRFDAGERPETGILNRMDNIILSLIQLPDGQYEGENWYLILPGRELRDSELLQLVDAFGEAGIRFRADMLNWHNCMRGGAVEETRSLKNDERERYSALGEQFFRGGLRPETPYTASVTDDGIGCVTLSDDVFNLFGSKPYFSFLPARRLTDEELLQFYAWNNPGQESSPNEINSYETRLRQELNSRLGMPLSAVRSIDSERIDTFDNYWGDNRKTYSAAFEAQSGESGWSWRGDIDVSTGKLICAAVITDPSVSMENGPRSDIRMDPWDSRWPLIAEQTVTSLWTDDSAEISRVQSWGEASANGLSFCAKIRIIMTDGAVCEAYVSYLTETVLWIDYYDAVSIELLDKYSDYEYGRRADSDNE